jgi:hypothetical protein
MKWFIATTIGALLLAIAPAAVAQTAQPAPICYHENGKLICPHPVVKAKPAPIVGHHPPFAGFPIPGWHNPIPVHG